MTPRLEKYADMYSALGLVDAYDAHSPQSTFLLSGEDGDGLAVTARLLAARLCGADTKKAFADHADIMVYPKQAVEGETKPKSGKKQKKADTSKPLPVTVEDVGDIIDSLYLTPFEFDRRVYIIENADSMSEICQNKLLKSLEEPPSRVCFILCACGGMLATVESRCTRIELPAFSVEATERALAMYHDDDEAIRLAARASRGNLGFAERILSGGEFLSAYKDAIDIIKCATGSRNFGTVSAIYDKYTRERAAAVLGVVEYLLGDIAKLLSDVPTVFDRKDIMPLCTGYTPLCAAVCAEHVRDAQRRLAANCMAQAVLDRLVLKIMEERSLCLK